MLPKKQKKRRQERENSNQIADYCLFNESGKILNCGRCHIDNISSSGLGLRVKSPFFKYDGIQVSFIFKDRLYYCKGTITRNISWCQRTGMQINKIQKFSLNKINLQNSP